MPKANELDQTVEEGLPEVLKKKDVLLSVRDIHKSFGSNDVLKGISLDLRPGEVLALIGGNGAGKSTLMKIIMGIYSPDSGEVLIDNQKVDVSNPKVALEHSIYMVPQEPMLFPNMTVRENVTIGFDAKQADLDRELQSVMDEIGWHLDPDRKASTLSIAEQGMVEILRGMMRHSEVLILDEPTSALTFDEVNALFKVIEGLREKNIGIIYITHRLAEVFQIATSVSILRDGIVTMPGPNSYPGAGAGEVSAGLVCSGIVSAGADSVGTGSVGSVTAGTAGPTR